MEKLKIDRTKLITKSAYARLKGISKQSVNYMVKNAKVKTVELKGTTLILLD